MKRDEINTYLYITIGLTIVFWLLALKVTGTEIKISVVALKQIPKAITADLIVILFFIKWGWKLPIFRGWLVKQPNLQGTWKGYLQSTWLDPETGAIKPPIPVQLVIRQSFLSINCSLFTEESQSRSYQASLIQDDEKGINQLVYSYTNRPLAIYRHRSEIHDGTVSLAVVGQPPIELKGEYWTSRKTTGHMELQFKSRTVAEAFTPVSFTTKQVNM